MSDCSHEPTACTLLLAEVLLHTGPCVTGCFDDLQIIPGVTELVLLLCSACNKGSWEGCG